MTSNCMAVSPMIGTKAAIDVSMSPAQAASLESTCSNSAQLSASCSSPCFEDAIQDARSSAGQDMRRAQRSPDTSSRAPHVWRPKPRPGGNRESASTAPSSGDGYTAEGEDSHEHPAGETGRPRLVHSTAERMSECVEAFAGTVVTDQPAQAVHAITEAVEHELPPPVEPLQVLSASIVKSLGRLSAPGSAASVRGTFAMRAQGDRVWSAEMRPTEMAPVSTEPATRDLGQWVSTRGESGLPDQPGVGGSAGAVPEEAFQPVPGQPFPSMSPPAPVQGVQRFSGPLSSEMSGLAGSLTNDLTPLGSQGSTVNVDLMARSVTVDSPADPKRLASVVYPAHPENEDAVSGQVIERAQLVRVPESPILATVESGGVQEGKVAPEVSPGRLMNTEPLPSNQVREAPGEYQAAMQPLVPSEQPELRPQTAPAAGTAATVSQDLAPQTEISESQQPPHVRLTRRTDEPGVLDNQIQRAMRATTKINRTAEARERFAEESLPGAEKASRPAERPEHLMVESHKQTEKPSQAVESAVYENSSRARSRSAGSMAAVAERPGVKSESAGRAYKPGTVVAKVNEDAAFSRPRVQAEGTGRSKVQDGNQARFAQEVARARQIGDAYEVARARQIGDAYEVARARQIGDAYEVASRSDMRDTMRVPAARSTDTTTVASRDVPDAVHHASVDATERDSSDQNALRGEKSRSLPRDRTGTGQALKSESAKPVTSPDGFEQTSVAGQRVQLNAERSNAVNGPAEPAGSRSVVDQIVNRVSLDAGSSKPTITIGLKPERLGNVEVRVEVDNGRIVASIQAETEDARKILRSSTDRLVNAMKDQGLQVSEIRISAVQTAQADSNRDGMRQQLGQGQPGSGVETDFQMNSQGNYEHRGQPGFDKSGVYAMWDGYPADAPESLEESGPAMAARQVREMGRLEYRA